MKKIVITLLFLGMCTSGLMAQEITSFPSFWGESFYQDKEKLSWKQIDAIMKESQVAQVQWQKSKKQLLGGMIFGAANFGSAIWYLSAEDNDKDTVAPLVTFGGTAIIGSIFYWSALKNKKMAILNYNDSLGKETSFYLVPTSNENGFGLALKF